MIKYKAILPLGVAFLIFFLVFWSGANKSWVWTNKKSYEIGEEVIIYVCNRSNRTVELGFWRIDKKVDGEWKTIFSPIRIMLYIPLEPNEVKSLTWNQRDDNGNQVSSGHYRVVWTPGGISKDFTHEFEIH